MELLALDEKANQIKIKIDKQSRKYLEFGRTNFKKLIGFCSRSIKKV